MTGILSDPQTLALNLTNAVLGLLTLACFGAVVWAVAAAAVDRIRRGGERHTGLTR